MLCNVKGDGFFLINLLFKKRKEKKNYYYTIRHKTIHQNVFSVVSRAFPLEIRRGSPFPIFSSLQNPTPQNPSGGSAIRLSLEA